MRISDWSSDVCSSDLAEVAERALGFEDNHPFAWTRRSGETHLLQVLDPADHQPSGLGIGGAGRLGAQVDVPGLVGGDADLHIERSEESRVGQECVSTVRSWWAWYHSSKNNTQNN